MTKMRIDAHCIDDEFEAKILKDYGVTITDRSDAPWEWEFTGERAQLEAMLAEHWSDTAPFCWQEEGKAREYPLPPVGDNGYTAKQMQAHARHVSLYENTHMLEVLKHITNIQTPKMAGTRYDFQQLAHDALVSVGAA